MEPDESPPPTPPFVKPDYPRKGWAEAFPSVKQDPLLMGDIVNEFDKEEWEW